MNDLQNKQAIRAAILDFAGRPLAEAARRFFATLGYESGRTVPIESVAAFCEQFDPENRLDHPGAHKGQWNSIHLLFQLTDEELSRNTSLFRDSSVNPSLLQSYVFFAIELSGGDYARGKLASITRQLNRIFSMPVMVMFKMGMAKDGEKISIALINRRQNKYEESRDVLGKVTLIQNISLAKPHPGHLDIIASFSTQELSARKKPVGNFDQLHAAWEEVFNVELLNKRFYQKLANWYFWAVKQVAFPPGGGEDVAKRNSVAVIRLLTRLIFAWFIKEKGLIPAHLFEPAQLKSLLKTDPTESAENSTYYLAILQNLFFATLNVEMGSDRGSDRKWAADGGGMKGDRLIHSLYRHKELFHDADAALNLFSGIPFLNGGLFECLDRELTERDFQRNPELKGLAVKEGNGHVLRVDGFSRRNDAQPVVPNKIFFGGEAGADLNAELGTNDKRVDVDGLIDIFSSYKFTVEENTPLEEEVALDPELLGKIFENLLASYNEDTKSTARKLSGSFYTPREVVDYMVDEALIAYFERALFSLSTLRSNEGEKKTQTRAINEVFDFGTQPGELDLAISSGPDSNFSSLIAKEDGNEKALEVKLRNLLSYANIPNEFTEPEAKTLIAAIEQLKIFDPACGSGAFPMGILNKLVHVIRKLDPGNELWKVQNLAPLSAQLAEARKIPDPSLRDSKVEEAEAALEKARRDFANVRHADYTRKLYLIEKCIFGADIQPVAVQIAKLRFFIALVVSQDVDKAKDNWGITALPNLETKIVAADSLTPIREVKHGMMESYELGHGGIKTIEADLHDASERYFSARSSKTKRKYREIIQNLRDSLADELEQSGFSTEKAQQLVHWNPFDQNAAADFFDPEWMFQLGDGFDIVIGNPPYVRQEKIKHLKDKLKKHYECYAGAADLYIYFYERSIRLLKPGGAFAFITSNKWYRAKYGEKLREWMNCNTRLKCIIDFGDEDVFEAIAYPTIVIATRRPQPVKVPGEGEDVLAHNWTGEHPIEHFPKIFAHAAFAVPQVELSRDGWQLEPSLKRRLLKRIRAVGTPLGEWCDGRFYRGILTGLNEAFVIDGTTRTRLIAEDPKSAEIIKPFLRGRDVKRWRVEFANQYLIKIESSENISHPWSGKSEREAEKIFAQHFPAIHAHFEKHRQGMIDRYDQGKFFWELRACAYWQEFEGPKIIVPAIAEKPNFAPDIQGHYSNNKSTIFLPPLINVALGVLNSSVNTWFAAQVCSTKQGGFYDFEPRYSGQLVVPKGTQKQYGILDAAVDAVTAIVVSRFEQLINGLVYELFFPEDLHQANIRLFDACEKEGIANLAVLKDKLLADAAAELATRIFTANHQIYGMLHDLQGLPVVRLIEGRD